MMSDTKPLNWVRKPGVGYEVTRREDGGMNLVFTDLSEITIQDWREFAEEHLLDSDRLTRNLYDLRQVPAIPEHAIKLAVEVNNDPSTRNIRLAVVVSSEAAKQSIMEIAAGTIGSGAAIKIFTDLTQAEAWLSKPLDQII